MSIDYKAFTKDLLKVCQKHGVAIIAKEDQTVLIGSSDARCISDYPYNGIEISPERATLLSMTHEYICVERKKE